MEISKERFLAICRRKGTTGLTTWLLYNILIKNKENDNK